jgi:hypothetical protein
VIDGLSFGNGVIEVELAGVPDTAVFEGARGFVGVAFRVQNDLRTYDAFYLRPTSTSRTRASRGFVCGKRAPRSTSPTSTSCRGSGPRSESRFTGRGRR